MKQLGNLALVCAKRDDVSLDISDGQVNVYVDCGGDACEYMSCAWDNDGVIDAMVRELNFGKFKQKGV